MRLRKFLPTVLTLAMTLAFASQTVHAKARGSSISSSKSALTGTNTGARTGLFFSDTAQTPGDGKAFFTGHLLYGMDDNFDLLQIPFGANYGIGPDFELSGTLEFVHLSLDLPANAAADDSRSGLGNITVGGKYVIRHPGEIPPDIGFGVDVSHGPLSDDLGDDATDVTFKGMITHTVAGGLLVNGGLGFLVLGDRGGQDNDVVVQVNGGVGYPLTPALTGIAELGVNQFGDDDGIFAFGVRGGLRQRFQILLGFGIGDASPDITLGAGVRFGS